MTSRDFCFWLQGLFELSNPEVMTAEQTAAVKRHLALVFKHEPPAQPSRVPGSEVGIVLGMYELHSFPSAHMDTLGFMRWLNTMAADGLDVIGNTPITGIQYLFRRRPLGAS